MIVSARFLACSSKWAYISMPAISAKRMRSGNFDPFFGVGIRRAWDDLVDWDRMAKEGSCVERDRNTERDIYIYIYPYKHTYRRTDVQTRERKERRQ
jgi:hypothetical protein